MTPFQFVHTIQLVDSLFPVGAFAYSDGLETAATSGVVSDAESLGLWMNHYLDAVFVPCEGLALSRCVQSIQRGDWTAVKTLDEELTALKPSAAVRASSQSVGKRVLATYASLFEDDELMSVLRSLPYCNAPIAYGAVFAHRGLDTREAILAFGYTRMAGCVSAGLRLLSIGQNQGQVLLTAALGRLPPAADLICDMGDEPLRAFSPKMDLQQMNHRYVYSRLFRS